MTKAQQALKEDIEKIKDDATIEKVRIFIMGIFAQQSISENQRNPPMQTLQLQRQERNMNENPILEQLKREADIMGG